MIFYRLETYEKLIGYLFVAESIADLPDYIGFAGRNFELMLLFVGIFPATMWVKSSFATLYQSVLLQREKPAEELPA